MTEVLTTIIIAVIASSGFWALIQALIVNRKAKQSVERQAMLALLHDKLYYLCEKHIQRGYITPDEHENLMYLYNPYKEIGGNGTCEKLLKEVEKLPLAKEEGEES